MPKIHAGHYHRPSGYHTAYGGDLTLCGRIIPTGRIIFGNDARRVTCRTCKTTKKARTP